MFSYCFSTSRQEMLNLACVLEKAVESSHRVESLRDRRDGIKYTERGIALSRRKDILSMENRRQ